MLSTPDVLNVPTALAPVTIGMLSTFGLSGTLAQPTFGMLSTFGMSGTPPARATVPPAPPSGARSEIPA